MIVIKSMKVNPEVKNRIFFRARVNLNATSQVNHPIVAYSIKMKMLAKFSESHSAR